MLQKLNSSHNFCSTIDVLTELKHIIYDDSDSSLFPYLECYENIKVCYIQESEKFLLNLNVHFDSLVEIKDKTFQNNKAISIKISKNKDQLQDTIFALVKTKYNPRILCTFLMNNVFTPIVTQQVTIKFIEHETDSVKLVLTYDIQPRDCLEYPNYKMVFHNLKKVFNCLNYINIVVSDETCIYDIFAEHLKVPLIQLLMEQCLSNSVPDNFIDMKESKLKEDIDDFLKYLYEIKFLSKNDNESKKLDMFTEKIYFLCSRRFSNNMFIQATALMKKDLHDGVKVKGHSISDPNNKNNLSDYTISKSTKQLTELLDFLVTNANENTDLDVKIDMFNTISMILERYIDIVEDHHGELIKCIPQQAAFFYNNCIYLSEWSLRSNIETHLIKDIPQYLVNHGLRVFNQLLNSQKNTLLESLNNLDFTLPACELDPQCIKILRKCLRQLDILHNVWDNILSEHFYYSTISKLLDEICIAFIQKILEMEDLTSSVAYELDNIIGLILKKSQLLFEVSLFFFI